MIENKLTIFHVYRKNGTSIFLYPFTRKQNLVELLEKNEIIGVYGREPRIESLTLLRNDLYRLVEQAVKDWTAERKFIPRFLISTGFFLFLYIFMSMVIRDPIPMVDELLIGLAGGILLYIFLSKRDSDSKPATEMKVRLRTKVDEIVFNEDSFVIEAELYLKHCEDNSDMEQLLLNMMKDKNNEMFTHSDKEKVRQFLSSIRLLYNEKEMKKHEKMLKKMSVEENADLNQRRMLRWMSSRKVDPFLFAVYTKIKSGKSD
ncbi:MAG: hypothetical protein JEZ04_15855 [Spirochaetales bacterium]|nr:hypothetical protein [Spirochaetales bacterium]